MREAFEREVVSIDAALGALEAGTYGRCAVCDRPIGFERLAAVLGTGLCITCAAGR
ncbi:MAG: TraR/DksA C4-type zinc finger protein [Acidimicrobiales bacterium]